MNELKSFDDAVKSGIVKTESPGTQSKIMERKKSKREIAFAYQEKFRGDLDIIISINDLKEKVVKYALNVWNTIPIHLREYVGIFEIIKTKKLSPTGFYDFDNRRMRIYYNKNQPIEEIKYVMIHEFAHIESLMKTNKEFMKWVRGFQTRVGGPISTSHKLYEWELRKVSDNMWFEEAYSITAESFHWKNEMFERVLEYEDREFVWTEKMKKNLTESQKLYKELKSK